MISVAFWWLIRHTRQEQRQCPPPTLMITCRARFWPVPTPTPSVPDRPAPALFALNLCCMYTFKLVGLQKILARLSQSVYCIRPCKLHMSVASPANQSLIGNDVVPNSLTFTP